MILGMLRTKFAALLIGVGGVGLAATFGTTNKLIETITSLGIGGAAVRDISSALANNDQQAIGRTVLSLKRLCWFTGLLGMLVTVALSPLIGTLTFGSDVHNLEIASLGLIVLFFNVSIGQMALIQGARRIGDIARIKVASAAIATAITICLYLWLGERGIVPALVISSLIQLAMSSYFAKHVPVPVVKMSWRESVNEASSIVKLGFAMMWAVLMFNLVNYARVTMITNQIDLKAVGYYSAAFALSGMFVNFVLQAMGTDYYPRLAALVDDEHSMGKLVNEQVEISLLLAVPGLLATLFIAPWIIHVFYTSEFLPAVGLLRWFILGCLASVVSSPLTYILYVMGRSKWVVLSQTLYYSVYIAVLWGLLSVLGLKGVAIAHLIMSILYIFFIYAITKRLASFCWNRQVLRMMFNIFILFTCALVFVSHASLMVSTIVGTCVAICTTIICLKSLIIRVDSESKIIKKIIAIPGLRFLMSTKPS